MVIMDWKFGVRMGSILIICGIVAVVLYKKWHSLHNTQNTQKIQKMSTLPPADEETLDRVLQGSAEHDTKFTSCTQDLCRDDYEIDASVPEYVEEMNDYLGEEKQMVGANIADVYDNLTRAPDISQGKELEMHSDSGIAALDPWDDTPYARL